MKAYLLSDGEFQTDRAKQLLALITTELEHRGAEVSKHAIERDELQFCRGCFDCWTKTPGECIMKDGIVEIYDLMGHPVDVALKLTAVAVNGAKRIMVPAAQQTADFQSGELKEWVIQPIKLKPGLNEIMLRDSLGGVSQAALLVNSIEVSALTPAN